jgi:hypothetical protein
VRVVKAKVEILVILSLHFGFRFWADCRMRAYRLAALESGLLVNV